MERIKLSKSEKQVLRNIASGASYWPNGIGAATLAACADMLKDCGLIDASFASGHELVNAKLTHKGAMYLQENPHLCNPVNWAIIGSIASIIAALVAIFALFVVCSSNKCV